MGIQWPGFHIRSLVLNPHYSEGNVGMEEYLDSHQTQNSGHPHRTQLENSWLISLTGKRGICWLDALLDSVMLLRHLT